VRTSPARLKGPQQTRARVLLSTPLKILLQVRKINLSSTEIPIEKECKNALKSGEEL
jgi:hypothetical protein